MDLFELSDDQMYALPAKELRNIEVFNKIIRRDRGSERDSQGRKKLRAGAELAYVYHMADPRSPYAQYHKEDNTRHNRIKEDFLPDDWEPDEQIFDAINLYRDLYISPSAKLLDSAITGLHKLRSFLEEVDLNEFDENGRPVYKPSDIMTPLKHMGSVVDSLKKLQEKVAAEDQTGSVNKSNVKTNKYSE